MISVRPWSFPASAMPVIVTLAYLFWKQADMEWIYGLWALVNILIFHSSGNTWSDYFDYRKKVDDQDTFGAKTLTGGMFEPHEIRNLAICLLAAGILSGTAMVFCTGITLLWIGMAGAALTLLYPALKFHALGDADIFVVFGLLSTIGTSYAATGAIDWSVIWIAVPVGLITVAILHANNARDISTDNRAEISTFAMKMGEKASIIIYGFEVLFPLVWIAGCIIAGIFPLWSLLTVPAFALAAKNTSIMSRLANGGTASISDLDQRTARLQLVFSLLLSVSFILSGILNNF